ncbi:MAG: hypothetical protein IKB75_07505 [Clostridia bacterium]|nr:hypothetical protein [Clostridia bacterium]
MITINGLKKTTVLMLGVILLLSAIVGCDPVEPSGDPSLTTGEGTAATVGTQATTAARTLPAGEITTEATTEATTAATTSQPYWDGDALCFRAGTYIQEPSLSAYLTLNFKIEDSKIYIGDVLYEKVSPGSFLDIVYQQGFLNEVNRRDQANGNQNIFDTLQQIKECEPYCVLKKQGDDTMIAVYKFDTVYYFVRCFEDGSIMRIHYAILDQEVF